mmetsp:Transcript_127349/g.220752  ORF Transcript_127349/g.220752 Transcript_127349/m.220752 type:complete len:212 (+) Transcript_127349:252-887(+)
MREGFRARTRVSWWSSSSTWTFWTLWTQVTWYARSALCSRYTCEAFRSIFAGRSWRSWRSTSRCWSRGGVVANLCQCPACCLSHNWDPAAPIYSVSFVLMFLSLPTSSHKAAALRCVRAAVQQLVTNAASQAIDVQHVRAAVRMHFGIDRPSVQVIPVAGGRCGKGFHSRLRSCSCCQSMPASNEDRQAPHERGGRHLAGSQQWRPALTHG